MVHIITTGVISKVSETFLRQVCRPWETGIASFLTRDWAMWKLLSAQLKSTLLLPGLGFVTITCGNYLHLIYLKQDNNIKVAVKTIVAGSAAKPLHRNKQCTTDNVTNFVRHPITEDLQRYLTHFDLVISRRLLHEQSATAISIFEHAVNIAVIRTNCSV